MTLRSIAFANLRRRKTRAAFLIAGLLIGVATVVALLTLSRSMAGEAEANLESYGANIVITPKAEDVALTYGGIDVGGVSVGDQVLTEADLERVRAIPARGSLAAVAPELVGPVQVRGRRALLMGVDPKPQLALKRWWSIAAGGRPPQSGDELLVGAGAAEVLDLQMGDYVRIEGKRFTVTGTLWPTGGQDDDLLIAELGAVQRLLDRPDELTLIEVAAAYSGAPVDEVVRQLQAALPGAEVSTVREAVASRLHAVDQFKGFSLVIVGIVIAIEILVVFLTMTGSVSERTTEIGVFRAIGFRRAQITRLVLLEAVVAGVAAGVLGYAAGMALSYGVLPFLAEGAAVVWTPPLAVAAVAAAALVGGVAALYPALRAGKMDPTEALRAL
jgi:putative ABC transport system permease protein